MKMSKLALLGTALVGGIAAWAQEYPLAEARFDYSYARYASSGTYTKGHSLNGGGGTFVYNISEYLGIKPTSKAMAVPTRNSSYPRVLAPISHTEEQVTCKKLIYLLVRSAPKGSRSKNSAVCSSSLWRCAFERIRQRL